MNIVILNDFIAAMMTYLPPTLFLKNIYSLRSDNLHGKLITNGSTTATHEHLAAVYTQ